jgi:magnesium chelatase subunit I
MLSDDAAVLYPECYERYQRGESISHYERVRLVELPLNATLDDVVGGINQRIAVQQQKVRLERGILARADRNLLYVDEVNLLDDDIVDAILDAAATGSYTVRRGPVAGTYRSKFVLIGSMNPEEGRLRPQILDRFGLRVNVRGLVSDAERREVYYRVRDYRQNPSLFIRKWEQATAAARAEIIQAQEILRDTYIPDAVIDVGLRLVNHLKIDSHRAEYTLFEAARAYAASDGRTDVQISDLRVVAPMALRQRRSEFMVNYFDRAMQEDQEIEGNIDAFITNQTSNNDQRQ